jgi:glycosyltransferase involved in cell wall biosynthesis
MACGLPVIARDVGGAAEQIVEGVTGRLVPPGDSCALAEAMVDYARDAALRARHGAAARGRIADQFSVDRMVRDYRRVLGI